MGAGIRAGSLRPSDEPVHSASLLHSEKKEGLGLGHPPITTPPSQCLYFFSSASSGAHSAVPVKKSAQDGAIAQRPPRACHASPEGDAGELRQVLPALGLSSAPSHRRSRSDKGGVHRSRRVI